MGSEAEQETANASPVDSDGSVSWEDFFGTSTDLVPQLLGMFDEQLARRPHGCTDVVLPELLQKRLSLRAPIHEQSSTNRESTMDPSPGSVDGKRLVDEKLPYRREPGLSPLRYSRRCRNAGRPLSGSSVASSTSSSGCSNQGNVSAVNPYLASVESLADTCASSQGSGDSGVATVSEASCRVGQEGAGQRRDSGEEEATTQKPRYCDPHRNPVERVLLEIVDTEAIYVEHLRQVIQGYLIYWRNDPTAFAQRMQLTDLFSNIEDIFEFNREFLKEIEKCGLDPVCVANTFIKHNSGFKVYTEYCTNYPRTVSVLTDLMSQEETADMFKERQAALGHALPLGSFLLKPVQRILKYHLLLENLSKEYGDEEEEGRAAIGEALDAMTGIAKHINAMKRRHEHAVRVQEIQSLLYGWPGPDLTTSGELVAEGRFRMRGAKAPRHAFLFDRMLLLTKKKEDGLLVYKAHIMCSNLMLIESIPGEPLSFHVIPFDNPRLQYTLQARNLEQKREWTLQIKRVILENYNVVIPSHARELVLQLGQTQPEEDALAERGSAKKQQQYSAPEYLEKRKQERERRRSETGLRQKFKKAGRKSETPTEDSPASPRKNQAEDTRLNDTREPILNRYSDGRGSKVKDRFTGWRRKSEPGFQSYVSLTQSDEERKDQDDEPPPPVDVETRQTEEAAKDDPEKPPGPEETKKKEQTVEEIVGHILMQSQEFQKLLGKKQQRFNKRIQMDTSDESEREDEDEYRKKGRARREQRLVRANNAWNSLQRDSQQLRLLYEDLRTEGRSQGCGCKGKVVQERRAMFEAFKRQSIVTESKVIKTALRIRENNEEREKETLEKIEGRCEASKSERASLESKRGREHAHKMGTERDLEGERVKETVEKVKDGDRWTAENQNKHGDQTERERSGEKCLNGQKLSDNPRKLNQRDLEQNEKARQKVRQKDQTEKDQTKRLNDQEDISRKDTNQTERRSDDYQTVKTPEIKGQESEKDSERKLEKGFGNYDNLQHVWDVLREEKDLDGNESPIRPAVWLTKLCEGLPTSPQKCGSLPRSFQINQEPSTQIGKSRFLQRDGKPMSERPFTIASDKPAEINLEDMERYASSCQPEERIAKFPTSSSSNLSSNSTFFYSLDMHISSTTNIHPDHKIYRANTAGTTLKNVLSKASTRLQGLRNTMSTETLECSEEIERTRYFRSLSASKLKKKGKSRHSRESSSDVEELIGCGTRTIDFRSPPPLYYKQGSSDLGARIAQSDYADPSVLFGGCKRYQKVVQDRQDSKDPQQSQQTALQGQKSQQTNQQQVQSCSIGREATEKSNRETCTSNQKTDQTSPEDQNCHKVSKDCQAGVADVEGRLGPDRPYWSNSKGRQDCEEPLYSNQFLKIPQIDQGVPRDHQNLYQSQKGLHQAQQNVLPGPQEVTEDHHDLYKDPSSPLKVHPDNQSYHKVLMGPLDLQKDNQGFLKPLKSPVPLPKDAKSHKECRKQIQPSMLKSQQDTEDHEKNCSSPSRRCFDNQQDRNPGEEVQKQARRGQKDWQVGSDEHQEPVSETDSFYERSFETIENYVDEEDAFRDSAIFSDAEDPARPVQEPQEPRRPAPVPVGRKKEAPVGRKPNVARKPEFLKPRSTFLEAQEPRNGLERSPGDPDNPGKDEEDVSEGQSQAGWVRKIVGQLQGHIET